MANCAVTCTNKSWYRTDFECTFDEQNVALYFMLQELEAIKARVREMEEEAEKLKEMQSEVEKQMNLSSPTAAATCELLN